MTYQNNFTLPAELLEQIASEGLDFLPELVRIMINAATQIDREKYLGAGHYERTSERRLNPRRSTSLLAAPGRMPILRALSASLERNASIAICPHFGGNQEHHRRLATGIQPLSSP